MLHAHASSCALTQHLLGSQGVNEAAPLQSWLATPTKPKTGHWVSKRRMCYGHMQACLVDRDSATQVLASRLEELKARWAVRSEGQGQGTATGQSWVPLRHPLARSSTYWLDSAHAMLSFSPSGQPAWSPVKLLRTASVRGWRQSESDGRLRSKRLRLPWPLPRWVRVRVACGQSSL